MGFSSAAPVWRNFSFYDEEPPEDIRMFGVKYHYRVDTDSQTYDDEKGLEEGETSDHVEDINIPYDGYLRQETKVHTKHLEKQREQPQPPQPEEEDVGIGGIFRVDTEEQTHASEGGEEVGKTEYTKADINETMDRLTFQGELAGEFSTTVDHDFYDEADFPSLMYEEAITSDI
mmetsp:Transcript_25592/g.42086  ORF Transcript_25592/g.42086 Transcript_25592/m.42086 type:complete len:174 (-) Transcript_25592:111-632(-)|eukprot:CAMPEP_0184671730 /NCGR_PEP_ID=MMETSP0308-20130426/85675_1 /TAXON_ID=38269 /ORGANISM="Gloeochaete witrockiana, Strain SAG 46.84" /LENGTH=173 /DNA_ID=CAMNT_0027118915 /DNA_START=302 /DNA_END=823 /DNA_ORIENTATION=+